MLIDSLLFDKKADEGSILIISDQSFLKALNWSSYTYAKQKTAVDITRTIELLKEQPDEFIQVRFVNIFELKLFMNQSVCCK